MSEAPMPTIGEGKSPENGCLETPKTGAFEWSQKRNCSENGTVTTHVAGLKELNMTASITPIAGEYDGLVEPATSEDVSRLAQMGEELHASSDHRVLGFDRQKVERLLATLIADPNGVVFVSRRENVIVGAFAGAVVPNWFSYDLIGVYYSFLVLPAARNDWRGTTLILAFVRWCERRGARQVKLGITPGIDVQTTSRLYRSLGFADSGVGFSKEVNHGSR